MKDFGMAIPCKEIIQCIFRDRVSGIKQHASSIKLPHLNSVVRKSCEAVSLSPVIGADMNRRRKLLKTLHFSRLLINVLYNLQE
jgi:hypothetical protein